MRHVKLLIIDKNVEGIHLLNKLEEIQIIEYKIYCQGFPEEYPQLNKHLMNQIKKLKKINTKLRVKIINFPYRPFFNFYKK